MAHDKARRPADRWAPLVLGAVIGMVVAGGIAVAVGAWQVSSGSASSSTYPAPVILPVYSATPSSQAISSPAPYPSSTSSQARSVSAVAEPAAAATSPEYSGYAPAPYQTSVSDAAREATKETSPEAEVLQLTPPANAPVLDPGHDKLEDD